MVPSSAQVIRFLLHPILLTVAAWVLALAIGAGRMANARLSFDDAQRADGNSGHTTIDFGGQWLMGRMLTSGHGQELYERRVQKEVLVNAFSNENNIGEAGLKDAEGLMRSMMGEGEGIGGPLYPPIHAFIMAPYAVGDHPQRAYFAIQWVMLGFCYLGGLGVSVMSRGRIWWPVASAFILAFPGCKGMMDLGQNSGQTLAILIWGWALVVRGRPILGGMIWGLLAYKAVWAASFFCGLILLRQWRVCLSMLAVGVLLAAATLPFVGVHSWFHWLEVGKEAADLYNVDASWIPLSRDLLGLPRRIMLDFQIERDLRDNLGARVFSVALWLAVFELTMRVYLLRPSRALPLTGPLPGFIFLAAWMCTYHFMYYDAMIAAFGVVVLLADPRLFLTRKDIHPAPAEPPWSGAPPDRVYLNSFVLTLLSFVLFNENVTRPARLHATVVVEVSVSQRILNDSSTEPAPRLHIGTGDAYPVETLAMLVLWFWCGGLVLWGRDEEKATDGIGKVG